MTPAQETLEQLYWGEELPLEKVAERLGCSRKTIYYWMVKYDIPRRPSMGPTHPRWKGGCTRTPQGYIKILAPTHPRASHGYVAQHILVWEQANGRPVPQGWLIHHLNGVKEDNRPINLVALPRRNHHGNLLLQATRKRVRELEARIKTLETQQQLWREEEKK